MSLKIGKWDPWEEMRKIDPNDPAQVEWLRKEDTPKVCPKCGKKHDNLNTTNHWEMNPFKDRYKDWCEGCWQKDFNLRDLTDDEVEWYADWTERQMKYHDNGSSCVHNDYHHPDFDWGEPGQKKEKQIKEFLEKKWNEEKKVKQKEERDALYQEAIDLLERAGYEKDDLTSNFVTLIELLIQRIDAKTKDSSNYTDGSFVRCG